MSISGFKKNRYLNIFKSINHDNIRFQAPLILKMYGVLNKINLRNENRYILCNFIDQNSDLLEIEEDIYFTNNQKTLHQLFLLAFNKAKKFDLLDALYNEYYTSVSAIGNKKEFKNYSNTV